MKTIGIIGGLSPESTVKYYEWLNAGAKKRLGGHHSARILLSSLDFGEFVALKAKDDWDGQGDLIVLEAERLERAGADFIILATNTMHMFADRIRAAVNIPFLHLAEATADQIIAQGIETIGLLGTRYTMEFDFYKAGLRKRGIEALVPDTADISEVNRIIYDELVHGVVSEASKASYRDIIASLEARGAKGIIMGCTEITLLVDSGDARVPLFDTTRIHVEKALDFAFEEPAIHG